MRISNLMTNHDLDYSIMDANGRTVGSGTVSKLGYASVSASAYLAPFTVTITSSKGDGEASASTADDEVGTFAKSSALKVKILEAA